MADRIDILINARNQSSSALDQVKRDFKQIDQLAGNLNRGLIGVGAAAGIGAVVAGLQQLGQAIDETARRGAIFQQLGDVLDDYAASVNASADAFVEAGRKASQGTIADFDLILNANRAIQFQVAQTSEEYAKLIELSTALGRAQGITDAQALDFITTGIARESRLILDNLGLIIDLDEATSAYASTLGKTADQLSQAERKTALLNAAYEQGTVAIAANKDAFDSAATQIERMDAAMNNAKTALGELFAPAIAVIAQNIATAAGAAAEQVNALNTGIDLTRAGDELTQLNQKIEAIRRQLRELENSKVEIEIRQGGSLTPDQLANYDQATTDARFELTQETRKLRAAENKYFGALRETNKAQAENAEVINQTSVEAQFATSAITAYAAAQQKAVADSNELDTALEKIPSRLSEIASLAQLRIILGAEIDYGELSPERFTQIVSDVQRAIPDLDFKLVGTLEKDGATDAQIEQLKRLIETARSSIPDLEIKLKTSLEAEGLDTSEITRRVAEYTDEFETLEKTQEAARKSLLSNAIKASDLIGDGKAFALAQQQYQEFVNTTNTLANQLFIGEIDTSQFEYGIGAALDDAASKFDLLASSGDDAIKGIQERLQSLYSLRDSIELNVSLTGDTAQFEAIESQVRQLESVLGLIDPAALRAAQGLSQTEIAAQRTDAALASIVTSTGGASVAMESFADSAAGAEREVFALDAALGSAPAGLVNLANAAIAAGVPLDQVAAKVAGLRAEFNALAGAQASARRSIFNAAVGISDVVGDDRAFQLATEETKKLEKSFEDLERAKFDGIITGEQYEYQMARLAATSTDAFDEIREADAEAKRLANTVGGDVSKAFDAIQGKVEGLLSGALNLDVGVNVDDFLPREDEINEDARRLADVAVRGWDSPWAQYLADKFPDLIGTAFDDGGDVKQSAARILKDFQDGLVPELLDKDTAKERVKRALIGEQNIAELAKEISAELNAEFGGQFSLNDIRATAGVTLGVQGAETEQLASQITQATAGIGTSLSGVGDNIRTGIVSALDGIGEAVTSTLSKQLSAEGSLKLLRQSGYDNGITWGEGFLESMDELTSNVLEKLASLVAPYVDGIQTTNASLTGAN